MPNIDPCCAKTNGKCCKGMPPSKLSRVVDGRRYFYHYDDERGSRWVLDGREGAYVFPCSLDAQDYVLRFDFHTPKSVYYAHHAGYEGGVWIWSADAGGGTSAPHAKSGLVLDKKSDKYFSFSPTGCQPAGEQFTLGNKKEMKNEPTK